MTERVQKILARAGYGSRRACEELVRAGRIQVDGKTVGLGATADPDTQHITVDGRPVVAERLEYWVLNKPPGVISTASDPQGRRTVVDCVPAQGRIFPVGRLDRETTGVLILTNDGEFTHRLLHPSRGVDKEYRVTIEGRLSDVSLRRLREGVELEDGRTAPAHVRALERDGKKTEMIMIIHEGRKRQIRRTLQALGHRVTHLHRTRFDGVSDEGLEVGAFRPLHPSELALLRASGGAA